MVARDGCKITARASRYIGRLCCVCVILFLPTGPFRMKDSQEMDNILSNLKAYGAEQDSTGGS